MQITVQEKIAIAKEGIRSKSSDGVSIQMYIDELYGLVGSERCFSFVAKVMNDKNGEITKQLVKIENLEEKVKGLEKTNAHVTGKDDVKESWEDPLPIKH